MRHAARTPTLTKPFARHNPCNARPRSPSRGRRSSRRGRRRRSSRHGRRRGRTVDDRTRQNESTTPAACIARRRNASRRPRRKARRRWRTRSDVERRCRNASARQHDDNNVRRSTPGRVTNYGGAEMRSPHAGHADGGKRPMDAADDGVARRKGHGMHWREYARTQQGTLSMRDWTMF